MLDSKHFNSVLNNLETYDEEFVEVLDKIIKLGVSVARNTEELREEIIDYDAVYQIYITDLNFNFWLKINKGSIIYKKGINRSASFRVKYTKDLIIKILKREMSGTDAFMRGLIKVDGDLAEGIRFTKLFRLFFKYLDQSYKKK
ncbi:hypothetical protein LCGC14_0750480 [marine sediment metagenome]|uniref:SCP2 domain-containing protein n=1 Tax=marine sediment metagenome TaxID=412755 RepID=A0A0F9QNZ2_9ZZZZ|nr:SCP2 sterol-binding domain-containing protein [archaeon]